MGRGLSEQQLAILTYCYSKGADGARATEILIDLYGLKSAARSWFHRLQDDGKEYGKAKASMYRTIRRLKQRGLLTQHWIPAERRSEWGKKYAVTEKGYRVTSGTNGSAVTVEQEA